MDASKPAEAVKNAVKTASDKIADALTPDVPGAPGSASPPVEEPTTPRDPLPPKTEQGAPQTRTATGAETGAPTTAKGQQGAFLTTSQGARLRDTDHSLKAGSRGPTLVRAAVFEAGMVPLLIAPHGGMVGGMPVQRTFATGRSVEFDAVLLAGAPAPAPDATPARDDKAGRPQAVAVDPRVLLLVEECWRHAKTIGAWGAGVTVLEQAGVSGTPGVVTAGSGVEALTAVQRLMAAHRVWERLPTSVA